MNQPELTVSRLPRSELVGQRYQKFIQPLFGGPHVIQRIKYLEWLLVANPRLPPGDDLPIYICYEHQQMLGQLAVIPAALTCCDQPLSSAWCIDFFVTQATQRRGVGQRLMQAAWEDFPILMTLGQTDLAYRFFLKHGWQHIGNLTRFRKLLSPAKTLPKLVAGKLKIRTRSPARLLPPENASSVSRMQVSVCNTPLDLEGYVEPKSKIGCALDRSKAFLAWRYFENPLQEYQLLRIDASDDETVLAALRFHRDGGWLQASLVDFLYPDGIADSKLSNASQAVVRYATLRGAEMFECRTSDQRLLDTLQTGRLSSTEIGQRFLLGVASTHESHELFRQANQIDAWRLSAADCDVDTLPAFQESLDVGN